MGRSGAIFAVIVAVGLAAGCDEREAAPPAPGLDGDTGGGPGIGTNPGRDDGGRPDGDGTAPHPDGGLPPGCVRVEPGDDANRATLSFVSADGGAAPAFLPTRAYAQWNPEACETLPEDRELLVALTEGECRTGLGKRLVIILQGDRVSTGVAPGPYPVAASDFMAMLFVAPQPGEVDADVWTNQPDATGNVTFDELGAEPGDRLRGSFDVTLPDADEPRDDPALRIEGAFDVPLEQSFDDVCVE